MSQKPPLPARLMLTYLMTMLWSVSALSLPKTSAFRDTTSQGRDITKAGPTVIRFLPDIGTVDHDVDSSSALHSSSFIWTDARFTGDLITKIPGFFLRDLGEPGQPLQLNRFGVDGRGIAILLDGRPLNDPITGSYDLYQIPLEYVDQIEIVDGARSMVTGPSSVAGALNFVTHQYNNNQPLTKFRYLQGPFEHTLSDGIFAQNVARGFNVMIGFQRQVTDGRFPNSKYDSWNVRSRVRFNYSDRLNIWVSDFYNKSTTGFNGGIDARRSRSVHDEVTALVRSRSSGETTSRRDVTLGVVAKLMRDSSMLTRAHLYYSTLEREYREVDGLLGTTLSSDANIASYWGIRAQQQLKIPLGSFEIGTEFERRRIEQSRTLGSRIEDYAALKAKGTLHFGELITANVFARIERLRKQQSFSYGVEFRRTVSDWLSFFGSFSRAIRLPAMQELYWSDSTVTRIGPISKESHSAYALGVRLFSGPSFELSLSGFGRRIIDPITYLPTKTSGTFPGVLIKNVPEASILGFTTSVLLRLWHIEATSALTYTDYKQGDTTKLWFPKVILHTELSYRDQFFDGVFDGKVGVRLRQMSRQEGLQFIPQTLAYTEQFEWIPGGYSTIDLFLIAKLGDAHLLLTWENPLNINYIITPVYPMPGRNIKLGVNWVFFD